MSKEEKLKLKIELTLLQFEIIKMKSDSHNFAGYKYKKEIEEIWLNTETLIKELEV